MAELNTKAAILTLLMKWAETRIAAIEEVLSQAQSSANEETKSSAGDKYETGKSMMQIEMENHSAQLREAVKLKTAIQQINPEAYHSVVVSGSIVFTSLGNYFISIGAGPQDVNGKKIMAISPASPIGQVLLGLKSGDHFEFRGKAGTVEKVC